MINKAPNQGLGPQNQQWRQWVEQGLQGLDRRLEDKYGNDITNSLRAINSSMRLLSDQVSVLAGFVPIANDSSVTNVVPTQPLPGFSLQPFISGVDPSITIEAPSGRILVSVSAVGTLEVSGGSPTSAGFAYAYVMPEIVSLSPLNSADGVVTGTTADGPIDFVTGMGSTFTRLYTVEPGTYTIRARRAVDTGGSSTGISFETIYRSISAQVIPALITP